MAIEGVRLTLVDQCRNMESENNVTFTYMLSPFYFARLQRLICILSAFIIVPDNG